MHQPTGQAHMSQVPPGWRCVATMHGTYASSLSLIPAPRNTRARVPDHRERHSALIQGLGLPLYFRVIPWIPWPFSFARCTGQYENDCTCYVQGEGETGNRSRSWPGPRTSGHSRTSLRSATLGLPAQHRLEDTTAGTHDYIDAGGRVTHGAVTEEVGQRRSSCRGCP